ncbi:hypothetical protein [Chlorogloea sp. CCALA 695]|nr:hypothetical protein [Chlorogloea sp. CCALA 695]
MVRQCWGSPGEVGGSISPGRYPVVDVIKSTFGKKSDRSRFHH